jgi:Flp pilus assembly protein TadB
MLDRAEVVHVKLLPKLAFFAAITSAFWGVSYAISGSVWRAVVGLAAAVGWLGIGFDLKRQRNTNRP